MLSPGVATGSIQNCIIQIFVNTYILQYSSIWSGLVNMSEDLYYKDPKHISIPNDFNILSRLCIMY